MRVFLSLVLYVFSFAVFSRELVVVAHRGGAALGAENSLTCIERGVESGADAVEVDVRVTRDGHVVVCHNATVDATTNGKGRVADMSLREVQALRVVDGDGRETTDSIPTLEQVLSLVDGRCGVLIEVKPGAGVGVEERVAGVVAAHNAAGWVSVQSFSDAVLERFRGLGVSFPLEKLIVFKVPFLPLIFDGSLRCFSLEKYSYVSSFNFHKRCLPRRLAAKIRARGKCVKVWTLNSPDEAPAALIDGVIVDNPLLWLSR